MLEPNRAFIIRSSAPHGVVECILPDEVATEILIRIPVPPLTRGKALVNLLTLDQPLFLQLGNRVMKSVQQVVACKEPHPHRLVAFGFPFSPLFLSLELCNIGGARPP